MKGNELLLKLKADNKQLKAKVGEAEARIQGMQKKTQTSGALMSSAMLGVTIAIAAIGLAMRKMIGLANVQEKAEAQLAAVIKSTGQAAGLTFQELTTMASGLQAVTTYGDEVIIPMQALLLTFTKIGRDVFPRATETVLNMATAMGTDLKSQALLLGKALNDPVMGLSALRRVGVQLAPEQEEQIRRFVKLGQVAKAQSIILEELNTQFGGQARAAAATYAGRMKQIANSAGDAGEEIAKNLIPGLTNLLETLIGTSSGGSVFITFLKSVTKYAGRALTGLTVLFNKISEGWNTFAANNLANRLGTLSENIRRVQSQVNAGAQSPVLINQLRQYRAEYERLTVQFNAANRAQTSARDASVRAIENQRDLESGASAAAFAESRRQLEQLRALQAARRGGTTEQVAKKEDPTEKMIVETTLLMRAWDGVTTHIKSALSSIDQASRQLVYNMMWGEGGWNNFQKNIKSIMKQLVADITYAIARAIILQAILAGTTGGKGGFLAGSVIGGMFEKGRLPSFAKGRMPIFSMGNVPADHFPAFIGANEAVINARSTRANYPLLKQMNDNPGQVAGGVTVQQTNNITGNVLSNDYVDDYIVKRLEWNARMNGTKLFGDQSL